MSSYKSLIKPLLFSLDPELAHHMTLRLGGCVRIPGVAALISHIFDCEDSRLEQYSFQKPSRLICGRG